MSTWLNQKILSIPIFTPKTYEFETEKLPKDLGETEKSFEIILERNIFNAEKTEIDLPLSLPETEIVSTDKDEGELIDTVEGEDIENTSLAIALAGTMIYGKQNSFAFISKKTSLHKYVIFGIGECFHAKTIRRDKNCSSESVKVLQIKDRWVLLLYQDTEQALRMVSNVSSGESSLKEKIQKQNQIKKSESKTKSTVFTPKQNKNANETPLTSSSLIEEGNTFHFKRVWVDEQLSNFEQLLNDARVIPTTKDEKPYFMFQFIKEESIYEKLGLKKNDIILEINGFIVDSVGKALKLLEVLQSEREISLMVERGGNPVKFHYYIN